MRINFSQLITGEGGKLSQEGLNSLFHIVSDLQDITGMNLAVNSDGDLTEQSNCSSGDSCSGGSGKAKDYLSGLISAKSTISVGESTGDGSFVNRNVDANHVNFSSPEASAFESSLKGKDKLTMGAGMLFLHETLHTDTGAGSLGKDASAFNDGGKFETGGAVDFLNEVRGDLGIAKRRYYRPVPTMNSGEALTLTRGNQRVNLPMYYIQKRKEEYRRDWKSAWGIIKWR